MLLIFGKGLKASAASVVMIILLSRDNIDTLIVVFEARLLSLGLGLRVGELSMCCRVIVEDIISKGVVGGHKSCLIFQGASPRVTTRSVPGETYLSGAGLKCDLVLESISTLSVPKHITLPTYFGQLWYLGGLNGYIRYYFRHFPLTYLLETGLGI